MQKKYLWSILCSFSVCVIALIALICVIALATAQDQQEKNEFLTRSSSCVPPSLAYGCAPNVSVDFDLFDIKDELSREGDKDEQVGVSIGTRSRSFQNINDGLESRSQGNKLKVFLVPHSHNDAGWLKTFEVYFTTITKNILDNMLEYMSNDPEMRFTWAEVAFFDLWWKQLDSNRRIRVKKLVANKQLEFIGGGWVMPDEASTHYVSYLTQLIEGHQWLQQQLNYTPIRGWTIDPFGLSPTYAYLQKRAGMESSAITRIHYSMKKYFAKKQIFEFNWRQSWEGTIKMADPNGQSDMFTHVMPSPTYDTADTCGPDHDFCSKFSREVAGETVIEVTDTAKIRERSINLLDQFREKSKDFVTKNILVPIGGDFKWDSSFSWNQGLGYLRSLMEYVNTREYLNAELKIATLDDYFNSVSEDLRKSRILPKSITGDFFTYADRNEDYWSGYFTSRIYHKVTERQLLAKLRTAQLTFALMTAEVYKKRGTLSFEFIGSLLEMLVESRRTLSLFQHHDGITGTSKDLVVLDYARKMDAALKKSMFITQQCMFILCNLESFGQNQLERISNHDVFFVPSSYKQNFRALRTDRLISIDETRSEKIVTVFNSLAETRTELIHVNVSSPNVKVFDADNNEVISEVLPVINYVKATRYHKPGVEIKNNQFDLVFLAEFQPLEILSFRIKYSKRPHESVRVRVMNSEAVFDGTLAQHFQISSGESSKGKDFAIQNHNFYLQFDENGTLNYAIQNEKEIPMSLSFFQYSTYSSGVYLFIPSKEATPVETDNPVIVVVEGHLESYVRAYYETVHQKITLQNNEGIASNAIHVELLVDVHEKHNYELIMRLQTEIKSRDIFYTDSNGFQMMKRKYLEDTPIQGNYYPVASSAYIEDQDLRMTLLAAQPGGASSLAPGQFEIMLDRIVNQDDYRGVGQGGTDNLPVISKFKILLESPTCESLNPSKFPRVQHARLSLEAHHQLHALLYPLTRMIEPESRNFDVGSSGLIPTYQIRDIQNIPCDVHLAGVFPLPQQEVDSYLPEARHEIAGLFHRLGFDPRFDTSQLSNTCDGSHSKMGRLRIQEIFGSLVQPRMELTSLNLVHEEAIAFTDDEILMKTMEIYAFRLHYYISDKA